MCTRCCCEELELVAIALTMDFILVMLSWSFSQFPAPTVFIFMLRVLLSRGRKGQLGLSRQVYTHRLVGRDQILLHPAISLQRSK